MDRLIRANEYIKQLAGIINYNPSLDMKPDIIYANLVRMDLSTYESNANLSFFEKWIERFKDKKNVTAFVDQRYPYFCQFVNGTPEDANVCVKMYIPMDKEHILYGATELFEFMAEQGIRHQSKIGRDTRNDDVVIRVYSVEDAAKIQQYVDNNPYIQEGMLPLNPFSIEHNKIAYATDGYLSYNEEIASYISKYLNYLKSNNHLPLASLEGFRSYVKNEYVSTFETGEKLAEFISQKGIRGTKESIANQMINYMEIAKLIVIATGEQAKLKDLVDHRQNSNVLTNRMTKRNIMISKIERCLKEKNMEHLIVKDLSHILECATIETYKQYGSAHAQAAIMGYIKLGTSRGFTTANKAREEISREMNQEDVISLVTNPNTGEIDVKNYVMYVKNKYQQEENRKKECFGRAIYETFQKYGYEHACVAIEDFIINNNASRFTRDNNSREQVLTNITPEDVKRMMVNPQTQQSDINMFINNVVTQYGGNGEATRQNA